MARKRITEFRAKSLLYQALGTTLVGKHVIADKSLQSQLKGLPTGKNYVLKVDQGVKGRMKKGLVAVNISPSDISSEIERMAASGYTHFFIEEYIPHKPDEEHFISIERDREGLLIHYSEKGGIYIEDHQDAVQKVIYSPDSISNITKTLQVSPTFIETVIKVFEESYMSFLEINPLVVTGGKTYILDMAVEVDSTAEFVVKGAWGEEDYVDGGKKNLPEEDNVVQLSKKSPAAFTLNVLNKDGAIFLLLSGGGASLVSADEVHNIGFGKELANYGEYSGGPSTEETYIYTKNVLSLLLRSKSQKKTLIISGGVANFTDVRITFKGVIKALDEVKDEMKKQNIKVYVRRGGPHQVEGLSMMKAFLEKEGLCGEVAGPDMILTDIVRKALKSL